MISGSGSLSKTGSGTMTLSGINTFTGGVTVGSGTLVLSNGGSSGAIRGTLTINSGATVKVTVTGGAVNFAQTGAATSATFANNFTLNDGSTISYSNDGIFTLGSSAAAASGTNTIAVYGSTTIAGRWDDKPMFLGGVLSGTGAISVRSFTSRSNNVWELGVLNDSNTYSGTITTSGSYSNGGAGIMVGGSNALQYATVIDNTQSGNVNDAGVVFNVNAATLGALGGSGNIVLAANTNISGGANNRPNIDGGPVALTVGGNGAATTYSGLMSGSGSLTKTGTGTMTLSGTNSYSGGTMVNGGTLVLAA